MYVSHVTEVLVCSEERRREIKFNKRNFRIRGVADGGFGLKYKSGKMAAHTFRTEVKMSGVTPPFSLCALTFRHYASYI